jgi:putative hemolysin
MSTMILEALIIVVLIIVNGLFAMSEIAVVSARKVRLQQRAEDGNPGARVALELAEAPDRFLSTVQIGITLIGVLAGAFGGATLAEKLGAQIGRIRALSHYSEAIGVSIVVLAITYLSLVIGELVPKRLALHNAERIASAVAIPTRTLSRLASPLVRLLTLSTDLVVQLLGVRPSSEPPITEAEIRIILEQGTQAGVFEKAEQEIVGRVLRLGERRIEALTTTRTEVEWLDLDDSREEIQGKLVNSLFSRFPVARGSLDQVVGVVQARDVMARCLTDQPVDLSAMLEPSIFVPESASSLELLELFRSSRSSMALVIDEHGGFQGVVTLTDLLEAIVGDMPVGEGPDELRAVQREDGSWLLDGLLPVDEFRELFELEAFPGEEIGQFRTLGGLVMARLQRVPRGGDWFEHEGLRFEVMDMDGHRVDKILVAPLKGGACRQRTERVVEVTSD